MYVLCKYDETDIENRDKEVSTWKDLFISEYQELDTNIRGPLILRTSREFDQP